MYERTINSSLTTLAIFWNCSAALPVQELGMQSADPPHDADLHKDKARRRLSAGTAGLSLLPLQGSNLDSSDSECG